MASPSKTNSPSPREAARDLLNSVKAHALTLFGLLAVMWMIEGLDWLLPFFDPDQYGIRPRSTQGLLGILAAPFLHGDFAHLAANSLPFLILGGLVMLGERGVFWSVTIFVIVVGGFAVWLIAPAHTVHIGASGLIFGYLGFLLSRGFFERSPTWILVALGLLLLYGGMIFGVLPGQRGVSWQSHLFGFVAGIIAAWAMFPRDRQLYRR